MKELINFVIHLTLLCLPVVLVYLVVEINKLKTLLTIILKNQEQTMANLQDFQNVAAEINTATTNISAYVTGAGMSAADQDTALTAVQEAAKALTAAIPAAPAA